MLEEVEQRYQDCPVAGVGTTTPAVRFICQSEKVTRAVEGLAASETREMRVEYTYDGYGNKIMEANHGVVSVGGGGCAACTRPAGVATLTQRAR